MCCVLWNHKKKVNTDTYGVVCCFLIMCFISKRNCTLNVFYFVIEDAYILNTFWQICTQKSHCFQTKFTKIHLVLTNFNIFAIVQLKYENH